MDETAVARVRARGMLTLCVGAVLAGCGGGGYGDNGGNTPPPTQNPPPPNPPAPSLFQQVQDQVFTPNCTGCHVGPNAPLGLRLDAGNSFALLVNVPSMQVPGTNRVIPGDPQNSYLVQKIEGRAAVGGQMPLGRAPLPQASIDLVRAWISAGAMMTSVSDGGSFMISSTIPAANEVSVAAVKEVQIVFNAEVDASLVTSAGIRIEASGRDGRFGDGNETIVPIVSTRVSPGNPRVLLVSPATPLMGDDYRVVIDELAGISLADISARVLDGDADGRAGGAFTVTFHGAQQKAQ